MYCWRNRINVRIIIPGEDIQVLIVYIYLKIMFNHYVKHLENSNFLCFFKQDNKNIQYIYMYQYHASSYDEFKRLCNICWGHPYNFHVTDNSLSCITENTDETQDTFFFLENGHKNF